MTPTPALPEEEVLHQAEVRPGSHWEKGVDQGEAEGSPKVGEHTAQGCTLLGIPHSLRASQRRVGCQLSPLSTGPRALSVSLPWNSELNKQLGGSDLSAFLLYDV